MAKILGLPFDDYVDKQVNIRQAKLAKTQKAPEDLVVFNSNTAWVRLTSGVKIEPDKANTLKDKLGVSVNDIQGTALARNLVLWNGVSSFSTDGNSAVLEPLKGGVGYGVNNAYGFLTTTDQGLKPPPGITGISSAYKNNGSLRQAQVSIKCYSRSQFEALEAIYLRLGYTVVLEWGNTTYFDNEGKIQQTRAYSIPNLLYRSDDNIDPETVQSRLKENKKNTACNYDGMLARISNYSWNLNEDLSFDIKLDLISVGDIIDSLKANLAGSAGSITTQVETSGSIQNLVTIVVNKEVSKVNKLFYEMYDEVFKGLLEKFGSEETKKAVAQADNVVKTAPLIDQIKSKYLPYFTKLEQPYQLFEKAVAAYTRLNKSYTAFLQDPEAQQIAVDFKLQGVGELFNLINESRNTSIKDEYKTAVTTLRAYFDGLKPGTADEDTTRLTYLQTYNNPLAVLVRTLQTGFLDSTEKYPVKDVKFSGSGPFVDKLENNFFFGVYGKDADGDPLSANF